jgi:PAS domain S-box-containing protein
VLSWNRAAQRIFGFAASEVIGRPASILLPTELVNEEGVLFQRMRAGERIERYETVRVTKGAARIEVSLTMSPLTDTSGTLMGVSVIARDISDQRDAQRALSSVSQKLIHAQEEERTRIGRELHDNIAQQLALLAESVATLPGDPGSSSESSRTERLQRQVSEIATDVHALSRELHSSKLEFLGLASAVKSFCHELAEQKNVVVDVIELIGDRPVPPNVSLCLFRVLQEALHNAVKHSGATGFEVELWESRGDVHLQVSDWGQGFELTEVSVGHGLGLVSMGERMKLVNGRLSVDTAPGRGTRIHARAPLQ